MKQWEMDEMRKRIALYTIIDLEKQNANLDDYIQKIADENMRKAFINVLTVRKWAEENGY